MTTIDWNTCTLHNQNSVDKWRCRPRKSRSCHKKNHLSTEIQECCLFRPIQFEILSICSYFFSVNVYCFHLQELSWNDFEGFVRVSHIRVEFYCLLLSLTIRCLEKKSIGEKRTSSVHYSKTVIKIPRKSIFQFLNI